jgi:hypothetical protein
MSTIPIPEPRVPALLRLLGARWRDGKRSFRMSWGEVSFGTPGWALSLHLFGDPNHFSLQIHIWRIVNAYIRLPFLARFAREPKEMMETWGVSYASEAGALFVRWGARSKIFTPFWRKWEHISHDVQRRDGSWVPYVGSWESGKEPDGRHVEQYPYHYLLRSGEKQDRTATIFVDRRIWRLKLLRWTRRFQRVRVSIDVTFSDEVGERSGSWKGGTIGCSYDLRPGEMPRECLKRMESERRFT